MPHPNNGLNMDDVEGYYTMFNGLDAESMDVAWQVIVDGNLDNTMLTTPVSMRSLPATTLRCN